MMTRWWLLLAALALAARVRAQRWTYTTALPSGPRWLHTHTVLADGDSFLIAGGEDLSTGEVHNTAYVYFPSNRTWLATGNMTATRAEHTATLLPDGRVLVVAGRGVTTYRTSAEIFDPQTGTWTATSAITQPRAGHGAVLLANGNVLVHGGTFGPQSYRNTALAYDPVSGNWTALAAGPRVAYHFIAAYGDSKVVVYGGKTNGTASGFTATASTYSFADNAWTTVANSTGQRAQGATVVVDTTVFFIGGVNNGSVLNTVAAFDTVAESITPSVGVLNTRRVLPAAVVLPSGAILVMGGTRSDGTALASVETSTDATGTTWVTGDAMRSARVGATASYMAPYNGGVVVVGGQLSDNVSLATAETGCFDNRSGAQCEKCRANYYGPDCTACPSCVNGTCSAGPTGNGTCLCTPGFGGALCDTCAPSYFGPTCAACGCVAGTCFDGPDGNGSCACFPGSTGPPYCSGCQSGYYGGACTACPACVNGTCVDGISGDGTCACSSGWAGTLCSICAVDHFGPACAPCPACVNGTCVDGISGNGTCACSSGWAGALCSACAVDHYGPACASCPACVNGGCNDGLAGDGTC